MKALRLAVAIFLLSTLLGRWPIAGATAPGLSAPAGLSIVELKITGSEFVLLENNSGSTITASQLSNYWLYAFNNADPTASGVSSSSQQLPAANLAAGQTLLLSDGGATCGAAVSANLSISLTDGGGYLEVVRNSLSGGALSQAVIDYVSWTSSTSSSTWSAQGANIITPGGSSTAATNERLTYGSYRFFNSSTSTYWWQPADVDAGDSCQLNAIGGGSISSPGSLGSGGLPPVSVVASSASLNASLPASDIGLSSPLINELLPNPASPQTDADDEFIELYNPNNSPFDLSGFSLEIGLTTKHDFTFDDGTTLDAKSFKAFYSADTHLSLSNSGGQVWLLDPDGNIASQSDAYGTAKDGQAWALANGAWYWTGTPTPGAANLINGVLADKVSKSKTKTTPVVGSASASSAGAASTGTASTAATAAAPIHAWTLAGVGSAALAYAAYEYRADLQNNFYRLRRYAEAWRASRK